MNKEWKEAQEWERKWHGDCANSFNEEAKQYVYAFKMGLASYATNWYGRRGWDFGDKTVLDVGGGAYSLLLKAKAKKRVVVDPCDFPNWVSIRYKECGIEYVKFPAEDMEFNEIFDMSFCYNILEHVMNPEKIIKKMRKYSKQIHVFEWINTGITEGHIHDLNRENLDKWFGGYGKVDYVNLPLRQPWAVGVGREWPLVGKCYYGVFLT